MTTTKFEERCYFCQYKEDCTEDKRMSDADVEACEDFTSAI